MNALRGFVTSLTKYFVDLVFFALLFVYMILLWLNVIFVTPVIGPLRHPVRSGLLLLIVGFGCALYHGLMADYLIGVSLMASHMMVRYSLHLYNRDATGSTLYWLLGCSTVLVVTSSVIAYANGMQLLWCVCALVTVVHLRLSTEVPHD